MAKYIKGKDGKFKGSIGDGKTNVPKAAQPPVGLTRTLLDLENGNKNLVRGGMSPITLDYDPLIEAQNMVDAMSTAGSFAERRRRKQLRKALETRFGRIDWKASENVAIADDSDDIFASWDEPAAAAQTPPEPPKLPRQPGTDRETLKAYDGRTGVLWVRVADEGEQQFVRDGNVRMLFEKIGSVSVAKDSEWYTKEHVLVQYGTYARRYNIDDVSFSPTDL